MTGRTWFRLTGVVSAVAGAIPAICWWWLQKTTVEYADRFAKEPADSPFSNEAFRATMKAAHSRDLAHALTWILPALVVAFSVALWWALQGPRRQ